MCPFESPAKKKFLGGSPRAATTKDGEVVLQGSNRSEGCVRGTLSYGTKILCCCVVMHMAGVVLKLNSFIKVFDCLCLIACVCVCVCGCACLTSAHMSTAKAEPVYGICDGNSGLA